VKLLVARDRWLSQTALNALFSLGFAVLIWAAVGARLTDTEPFRVPFELRVPPDVVVEYKDPVPGAGGLPLVELDVRGPHELLAKLRAPEIQGWKELKGLDEKALEQGQDQEVEVPTSSFRLPIKGLEVVATRPSSLKVSLSRLGKREFRVKSDIVGEPAPGFRQTTVLLDPDVVDVSGPKQLLAKQPAMLKTDPVDVTGRSESFPSIHDVVTPGGLVAKDRVRVTVVIEPVPIEREFVFPIRIVTSSAVFQPRYIIEPPESEWKARILLKGPVETLNALEARLRRFGEQPGEPFAFIRFSGPLEKGQADAYVEVVNLPRDVSYTKTKFVFMIKEAQKP
jgi:hypothetical protein